MATYIGFSTRGINQPQSTQSTVTGPQGGSGTLTQSVRVGRKFQLTDQDLVINDLLNAFSINQGEKPGNPAYGSNLKSFLFEPNTADVQAQMQQEVQRVIGQDPRLILNTVAVFPQENGVLIELELAINPFNNAIQLSLYLDRSSGSITTQ
jgi:phage baseplate assembly protein W